MSPILFALSVCSSHAEPPQSLMTAEYVSVLPSKHPFTEGDTMYQTENFREFASVYTQPNRANAAADFRKLADNAKTVNGKIWGLLGLRLLGEISQKDALAALNDFKDNPTMLMRCALYRDQNAAKVFKILESYLTRYPSCLENAKKSAQFFKPDLKLYEIPKDPEKLRILATAILKHSTVFANGGVYESGSIPIELWAANILADDDDKKLTADICMEIISESKNVEPKIYAIMILYEIGKTSAAEEEFSKLEKDTPVNLQGGCIFWQGKADAKLKNDVFNRTSQAFSKRNSDFYGSNCIWEMMKPLR